MASSLLNWIWSEEQSLSIGGVIYSLLRRETLHRPPTVPQEHFHSSFSWSSSSEVSFVSIRILCLQLTTMQAENKMQANSNSGSPGQGSLHQAPVTSRRAGSEGARAPPSWVPITASLQTLRLISSKDSSAPAPHSSPPEISAHHAFPSQVQTFQGRAPLGSTGWGAALRSTTISWGWDSVIGHLWKNHHQKPPSSDNGCSPGNHVDGAPRNTFPRREAATVPDTETDGCL